MEQEQLNTAYGASDGTTNNNASDGQTPKEKPPKLSANGIKNTLEALLFVASKPLKAKDFAKILELELSDVKLALETLAKEKKDSGVVLLENHGQYQLSTNSAYSTQVKNFLNAELREKLTDATVEVLAIIAYRQPISKAEIEAIRGVNSQYSLRSLLMRGLIEKTTNPNDARSFLYQTTTEFLMHLGLTSVGELPEFAKLVEHIKLPQTPGLNQQALSFESGSQTSNKISPTQTETAEPAPQESVDQKSSDDEIDEKGNKV